MLTYLGSMSLAVAVPLLFQMDAVLAVFILELTARWQAMVKLSLGAQLTLPAVTAKAMITAAAALIAKPPTIGVNASLAATAALGLKARIDALVALGKWNGTAGIHAWTYDGPISGMGAALQGAPAQAGLPPGAQVYAVVLLGGGAAQKTALKAVFKVA